MKARNIVRRRNSRGFTLLEMVIVLGIIALILGGAMKFMGGITEGAKIQRVKGDFDAISNALRMYKINNGTYPSQQQGLEALVTKPSGQPVPHEWTQLMKEVPQDPWGSKYGYFYPGRKDSSEFEIVSKGKDMQDNTADDKSSQDQ